MHEATIAITSKSIWFSWASLIKLWIMIISWKHTSSLKHILYMFCAEYQTIKLITKNVCTFLLSSQNSNMGPMIWKASIRHVELTHKIHTIYTPTCIQSCTQDESNNRTQHIMENSNYTNKLANISLPG